MGFGDIQYSSSISLKNFFNYLKKICHTNKFNLYQVVQCSVILNILTCKMLAISSNNQNINL